MKPSPKISVVTVTYNSAATLEKTILSVLNQTYPNIEYIIIDGGSTDGTVDIIEKYADRLTYWVSEPDKGIYDAMNKGIDAATGDYINFMNADDTFYDNEVIKKIFSTEYDDDVIYGKTLKITPNYTYIEKNRSIPFLNEGMAFGHQASFSKTELMKKIKFDLKYKSAADYDFFHTVMKKNGSFREVPFIVSIFNACDGFSARNRKLSWKEVDEINGRSSSRFWSVKYVLRCIDYDFRRFVKSVLPQSFVKKINIRNIKSDLERE